MADAADGPPVVALPERLDRRLRLGPFASARDALKFVTYAATGALVAPFASPYLWLGVIALGFTVCVFRPDGQALDERALSFLLWRFRTWGVGLRMNPGSRRAPGRRALLRIGPGQYVAILQTGGTPVTYLPPSELAHRFELFRDLLRSVDGGLGLSVTCVPIRSGPVIPDPVDTSRADRTASAGYRELVELLCRRRALRRVYVVLTGEKAGAEGISDLEVRTSALTERLVGLGLRVVRLRERALDDAARRWGWTWGSPAA